MNVHVLGHLEVLLLSEELLQVCQRESVLLVVLEEKQFIHHVSERQSGMLKSFVSQASLLFKNGAYKSSVPFGPEHIHSPPPPRHTPLRQKYLDGLVGVGDEGDEERQNHVDEEGDEGVEVRPAEEPHQLVLVLQLGEGGEHVIAVHEGEQAFGHSTQALELHDNTNLCNQQFD